MCNPLRKSVVETCDVVWPRRMYHKRLNANVTVLDPIVAIETENPRDEVVDTQIKIEKVVDDVRDDESFMCEVSKALSSLEQEVRRLGRTVHQITTYNPMTGKATEISAVHNYYVCLAELDNE